MPLFHLINPFLCSIMHGHAGVMELVDVLDSKSSAARRAGSSPATGTRNESVRSNALVSDWLFRDKSRASLRLCNDALCFPVAAEAFFWLKS